MTRILRCAFLMIVLTLAAQSASAQVTGGMPPFGSFGGGPDVIDLANLNSHISIPVLHKAGRGQNFTYDLSYDSSVWYPVTSGSTTSWQPVGNWGWRGQTEVALGYVTYATTYLRCWYDNGTLKGAYASDTINSNFVYHDSFGITHYYSMRYRSGPCSDPVNPVSQTTSDGSGYTLTFSDPDATITTRSGAVMAVPTGSAGSGKSVDRNGNIINVNTSGVFTDTLGQTALTVAGAGTQSSPLIITYTAPSGTPASYTVRYTTYTVRTNFGCSNVTDYGMNGTTTAPLVSEIDLPDTSKYTFTYEGTPGHTGNVTGRLASVTFPTGGTITYTYTGGSSGHITCSDGSASGLTRQTPDGTWAYTRMLGTGVASETTVFAPDGNQTIIQFQGIYETQRDTYQGSGPTISSLPIAESTLQTSNLLREIQTCYMGSVAPCTSAVVTGLTQRTVTNIFPGTPNNIESKQNFLYNGFGLLTEEDDYAYGSGAPGSLLRKKLVTIGTVGNTQVVQAASVQDGSGTVKAQTTITYDQGSVTPTFGTPQMVAPTAARANPTTISSLVQGSTTLNKTFAYFDTGNVQTATDWNGNQASYDYSNSFYDDPGDGMAPTPHSVSSPTNAYVKKITYPTVNSVALTATYGYYFGTGQQALATDANGQTIYSHFHDSLSRPTSAALPNTEWTRIVYNSTGTQVDTYTGTTNGSASTSCSVCRHDQTVLDSLDRMKNQFLVNDPDGQTEVDTTYDSNGHVATISNPYRGSSNGAETSAYDALGRTVQVTHADGNVARTYYGGAVGTGGGTTSQNCSSSTYGYGYPILAVDEAGHKRQTWTDSLGRVIETDESNSSGSLAVGTCYTYDLNNNLTQVTSLATTPNQMRSYTYDMLSRVTSTTTPESGTTNFYYTTSGGALCSGSPTAVCRRTDARSITTTYSYDALNRLTSTSYNDSGPTTPTLKYGYDAVALSGCTTAPPTLTIANGLGRRTAMCDGSGATSWSFDSVGNILTEKRMINGQTKAINYAYNLDGTIYTIQYPGNRTITYTEGNAQRMTAAADITNSINYAKAPSSGAMYAPTGALANVIHGYVSGGFAGITESYTYNNRLEFTGIQATSSAGTPLNLAYSYVTGNNGNIATQTNNAAAGRTQNYTYDSLNRLLSAQTQAASGGDCWGQSFGSNGPPPTLAADALANLFYTTATRCSSPQPRYTMDPANNNRFTGTGISYGATGDMTADTAYTYTYDAENRIITASGMTGGPYCYTYDGNGLRMMKAHANGGSCTGTVTVDMLYWRSTSGDTIAETDGSGSTTNSSYHEYVFFAGRRMAQSNPSSGSVYYYFADHLGSTRVVTNSSGSPCYEADFLPYGTENTPSGFTNTCSTNYKFTGYERDAETALGTSSGNDYAFARYYNSRLGRFMSGDPAGLLAADASDPQSWNQYTYVENNPENLIDPTGLFLCGTACNPFLTDPFFWRISRGGGWGPWWPPDDGTDRGGDGGGDGGTPQAQVKPPAPKPNPNGCAAQRVASAVKGLINLGVGAVKTGLAGASAASTPGTGPVGALGAAYLGIGAAGNITAGLVQLTGAITGNISQSNQAATLATAVTTVSGYIAFVATGGNLDKASAWATAESLGTSGSNGGMTGHLIDQGATIAQKLLLSADLGQSAADALGLNTNGSCH